MGVEIEKKGLIFNIQRYSLHDGPGIRTVVFFKGCPLRCKWCANPESLSVHSQVNYSSKDCIGCKQCVKVCKQKALSFDGQKIIVDREKCTTNFDCVKACPTGALSINGEWYTVEQVMEIVLKDKVFYKDLGGITLSGGEVLNQSDFAAQLLKQAKKEGINTAIETTGFSSWENYKKVLEYTDLVLFDVKHVDEETHEKYTGVSNKLILENLEKTLKLGKKVIARIPIIQSVNGNGKTIQAYIELFNRIGIKRVDILPFHKLGVAKYEMIGLTYTFKDEKTPSDEFMENIQTQMSNSGLDVKIGG